MRLADAQLADLYRLIAGQCRTPAQDAALARDLEPLIAEWIDQYRGGPDWWQEVATESGRDCQGGPEYRRRVITITEPWRRVDLDNRE